MKKGITLMVFLVIVATTTAQNELYLVRYRIIDHVQEARAASITWSPRGLRTEFGVFSIHEHDVHYKMDSTDMKGRYIISTSYGHTPQGKECEITFINYEDDWLDMFILSRTWFNEVIWKVEKRKRTK